MAVFHQSILTNPNSPSIIDAVNLANQSSDTSRTLSVSSHQIGDMILVMTGNRVATAPSLLSGYTNIVASNSINSFPRSFRIQYKFATSSTESISWTGAYGYIAVIRNASNIGQTNTINLNTTAGNTTWNIPNLSSLTSSGSKLIIAGTYFLGVSFGSPSSPYIAYSSSNLSTACFVYASKNIEASLTSKTCTVSGATIINNHYALEIL